MFDLSFTTPAAIKMFVIQNQSMKSFDLLLVKNWVDFII